MKIKIRKVCLRWFVAAALSVFSLGYALGATVSVEGGPSSVTVPIGTPTTLSPLFTITNTSGSPQVITSATFTSSSNYTSSVDLSNCTYSGIQSALPPQGCTVGVTLTGQAATTSPVAGTLTVVVQGIGSLTSRPPVEITVAGPTAPLAAWSLTAGAVEPTTVYTNTAEVVATYLVKNTDPTNSLTITGASPSSSNTSVLGSPTILSEAPGGLPVPSCVPLMNNGTPLTPGQECAYAIESKPAGTVGSATLSLKVTTNGSPDQNTASSAAVTVASSAVTFKVDIGIPNPLQLTLPGEDHGSTTYTVTNEGNLNQPLLITGTQVSSQFPNVVMVSPNLSGSCLTLPQKDNYPELGAGDSCNYVVNYVGKSAGIGSIGLEIETLNGSYDNQSGSQPSGTSTGVLWSDAVSVAYAIIESSEWSVGSPNPATLSVISGDPARPITFSVTNNNTTTALVLKSATAVVGGTDSTAVTATVSGKPTCSGGSAAKSSSSVSEPSGTEGVAQPNGGTCTYTVDVSGTNTGSSNLSATVGLSVESANGGGAQSSSSTSTITIKPPLSPGVAWTLTAVSTTPSSIPEDGSKASTVVYELQNTDGTTPLTLSSYSVSSSNTSLMSVTPENPSQGPACTNGGSVAPQSSCYYQFKAVALNAGIGTAQTELSVTTTNGNPLSSPTPVSSAPINIVSKTFPNSDWSVTGPSGEVEVNSGAAGSMQYTVQNTSPTPAVLVLDEGQVAGGGAVVYPLKGLKIDPAASTCIVNGEGAVLKEGGSCYYQLDYLAEAGVTSSELYQTTFMVYSQNGGSQGTAISIHVNPSPIPTMSLGTLSSGTVTQGETMTATFKLTAGTSTATLGAAEKSSSDVEVLGDLSFVAPPSGEVNCDGLTSLAANTSCYYVVQARGLKAGNARINLSVPYGGSAPVQSATGEVTVSAGTATWTLDALSPHQNSTTGKITVWFVVNNTGTQTLNLQNPTAGSNQEASFWSVEPTVASNPSFDGLYTPCGASLDAGSECAYSVSATPTTAAASNDVELTLSVDANGIPPHLSATSTSVVVVSTNPTVAWKLSAVKSSVTIPKDGTSVPVLFEVDNQDQSNNLTLSGLPQISSSSTDVTATLDTNYDGNGNDAPCPTSGIIGPNSTCYFAVDVSSQTAGATSSITATVAASNGTPTPQSAATDVTVGDQSGNASVDLQSTNLCSYPDPNHSQLCTINVTMPNYEAINYVVTNDTPNQATVLTVTGVEFEPGNQALMLCNSNDPSCLGSTGGSGGSGWCGDGATSQFYAQPGGPAGVTCALSLRVKGYKAGSYNESLKVDYTDEEGNTYSAYAKPIEYQVTSSGAASLEFTQQPSATPMDVNGGALAAPQTLTYQVKNTSGQTLYIFPSLTLPTKSSGGPTYSGGSSGQVMGGAYPGQTLSIQGAGGCFYQSTPQLTGELLPNQTCNITVTFPVPPSSVAAGTLYDQALSIPYATSSTYSATDSISYPIVFQVISLDQARTVTLTNNCKGSIYLGLATGTANSYFQSADPTPNCGGAGKTCPTACNTDSDCSPGTYCVITNAAGATYPGQCYYINPVPVQSGATNPYFLPGGLTPGASATLTIPQQVTNPSYTWLGNIIQNITIAARVDCENGECAVSDCSGGGTDPNGNFLSNWACAPDKGFNIPQSFGEMTFTTGNGGSSDFYDVSMVNGYTVPLSIEPVAPAGQACVNSVGNPYTCGSPGTTTDQSNSTSGQELKIGGATWSFDWSKHFAASDIPYITLVTPKGPDCTSSSSCGHGSVCGVSVESMLKLNGGAPSASPQLSCGKFLGYWDPTDACSDSGQTAGSPYNCNGGTTQYNSSGALGELYACNAPASAGSGAKAPASGYNGGAYNTTCGCVDWGLSAADNPDDPTAVPSGFTALTVPPAASPMNASAVAMCSGYTQTWLSGTEPSSSSIYSGYPFLFYYTMKAAVPSAYTYAFDDPYSTFTASTTCVSGSGCSSPSYSASNPNQMNYQVTFCPAGGENDSSTVPSAANPDSASALTQQQQQEAAVQATKQQVKSKAQAAAGNGTLKGDAVSKTTNGSTVAGALSKIHSMVTGSSS